MLEKQTKSRRLSYDVIRIVAICLVMLVHVSAYIVLYNTDPATKEFFFGNIVNGVSRAGVPLFLMLTGALLLNENRKFDAKVFYKKSFTWIALLMLGWTVAYAAFYAIAFPLLHHNPVAWDTVGKTMWNYALNLPTMYPHLWYMFMVVGLYLMIPVLRLFVKRENKSYILGIIIAFVVAQLAVNTFNILMTGWAFNLTTIVNKFHVEPATGFVGYVLTGWYVTNFKIAKRKRVALYGLSLAAVMFATSMVQTQIKATPGVRGNLYEPLTLTAFLYGLGVFVLLYTLCGEKQTKHRLTAMLSKDAFGVYIIHALWMELLTMWFPYWEFPVKSVVVYMLALFLAVAVVSYLTVWLVSLIPGVKKIFYIK